MTGVVPARAGVVPVVGWVASGMGRRPRASGGGPPSGSPTPEPAMSSPRERGWSSPTPACGPPPCVVPARAGVVPAQAAGGCRPAGRPRASGGGPCAPNATNCERQSSPRERGWSRAVLDRIREASVVPARAGVVLVAVHGLRADRGRPRASGGGPWSPSASAGLNWSSPVALHLWGRLDGVLPARAGVVPSRGARCSESPSRPRASGGGRRFRPARAAERESSPHERGGPESKAVVVKFKK